MTAGEAYRKFTILFKEHGITDASDEARVLICHVLNFDSARFFAQPDCVLTESELSALEALAERRLRGEPSAYLTGHREFYGIDFYVDNRVLIPRPETEILVEQAIKFARDFTGHVRRKIRIVDVGTGAGAIAVTLALNIPDAIIYAVDISEAALQVAEKNVMRYGLSQCINLCRGDLIERIEGKFDLVVANLPYITAVELISLPREIRQYEPAEALDGGNDGTVLIRRLIHQTAGRLNPGGALLMEIGEGQSESISQAALRVYPKADISLITDLTGIQRIIIIKPSDRHPLTLLYTFFKYLIVGLPNAVIYFGSIYLLTDILKLWYMLSVLIAVVLQAVTSFLLHRIWTWRRKKVALVSPLTVYRFIKYMLINLGGILLGLLLIFLFTDLLRIWYMVSVFISSCILQGLTFLANNYWTWGDIEDQELSKIESCLKKPAFQNFLSRLGIRMG